MSMTEETKTKLESSTGDLSDVENGNCSSSGSGGDTKKTCADCGTSKTPLWRSGPAGPKSLCNACGIKSRKKRQAASGTTKDDSKIKSKTSNNNNDLVLDTTRNVKIAKPDSETVKIAKSETVNVKNKIIKTDTEICNVYKRIKTDTEICSGNKKIKTDTESSNVNKKIKTSTESCNVNKKYVESWNGNNKKNVKRANRFLDLGFKVPAMKRSSVEKKRLWRKLGEEEQAAVLLMTLSCG